MGGRQGVGTCPFVETNRLNDMTNQSHKMRDHDSNAQQLYDEVNDKKSINNLDQFEQISSADSRDH